MKLRDAARFFDRVVCADAYNTDTTFKAQLDLYDDSKRDGGTVARRVVSVDKDVELPVRGAFTAHDETYLLGGLHVDSFDGEIVRKKYVAHRADGLATVKTLDQQLRSITGTSMYAARLWVKDMKEIEASSRLNAFFNLFFSSTETVAIGSIVTLSSRLHLVRQSFVSAAGFRLCEADELPSTAAVTVVYTDRSGQAYDPTTDAPGALTAASVPILWHRHQAGFDYLQQSAEKAEEGDITVNVSKTSVAAAGTRDTFVLSGYTWRVLDVRDNGDNVWILHARRA